MTQRLIWKGIACALLATSVPASAANWVDVGEDVDGAVWYVDQSSLRISGSIRYVWVQIDSSADESVDHWRSKKHYKVNCSNQTMRVLSILRYDAQSKLLSSQNQTDYTTGIGMNPVAPETMGDAVMRAACR